jgi:hypothetical protein
LYIFWKEKKEEQKKSEYIHFKRPPLHFVTSY